MKKISPPSRSDLQLHVIGLMCCLFSFSLFGQGVSNFQAPYIAHSDNFMMAVFQLPAEEVEGLLPDNLEVFVNEQGLVSVSLECYETDRIWGLPQYKTAFMVIDVEDHESKNGTPGHFALWGIVSPEEASQHLVQAFGFPFSYNPDIRFDNQDHQNSTVIDLAGGGQIRLTLAIDENSPFKSTGIVNMIGASKAKTLMISEVPWMSDGFSARIDDFKVEAGDNPYLKVLEGKNPIWAMVSNDQIFSYSVPEKK